MTDVLGSLIGFGAFLLLWIFPVVICFRKGKPGLAVIGILYPPLAWVGAIRIARPGSTYAQRNYPPGGAKMQLAIQRFPGARVPISVMDESAPEPPPIPGLDPIAIPGLDPIADKLRELSSHFAAAGSAFEILQQSDSSAEVRVSQKFMGSRSRRYRLTLDPGRQVQTEPLD